MMKGRCGMVLLMLLVLLVAGCEGEGVAYQRMNDLTAVAEMPGGGEKATAQAAVVARVGTAQAAEAAQAEAQAAREVAQATEDAAAAMAERQYVAMTADAQATQTAHERDLEQKRLWATQQAANATQCAQATQQAVSIQLTQQAASVQATAQAWALEQTATAEGWNRQGTATAQARAERATSTAEVVAWQVTSTAAAWDGRRTATAEAVGATAAAYQATATRAAEMREVTLGYGRDYGIPFVLLLALIGAVGLVVYGLRTLRERPVVIERSALGDAQPLAFRDGRGGWKLVDLDRQPGHVTRLLGSGETVAPQFREAGQEERTTARDQGVDGMTRPRLGGGHSGGREAELPGPPAARPDGLAGVRVLRRLDQAGTAGLLPPGQIEAIEAVWEED